MRSSIVVRRDISVQTYLGTIAEGIHLASALRLFLWQREELHPAPLCGAQSSTTRARAGSAELEALHQEGWNSPATFAVMSRFARARNVV